jgi:ABC-type transport system substrate-binding protein
LRDGVKWHDGKPFTAADVKCTYDLLIGKAKEKLRLNYREAWFLNLDEITTNGDREVTFHLKRPQPAFISLLASGYSPIYPCHVSARDMRTHPVGTGPFKFVEYKPNQSIKVARNPDYWKPGRPYLDGIEYTIIANRSTAILAFGAGKFDMTFPYEVSIPLVEQVKSQAPQAICEVKLMNGRANLLVNPAPPFDNPVLRRAMQLSLDRKSLHRHSRRGAIRRWRSAAAAAGGHLGYAQGDAGAADGIWAGCKEEPGRTPHLDAFTRLRPGQSAEGESLRPQYRMVSRSRGYFDRPAEGNLDRWRARCGRDCQLGPEVDAQRPHGRK